MPTIEQALEYMGIDYADELVRHNVSRAMATAARTLRGAVGEHKIGETVKITYDRNGSEDTADVTLEEMPQDNN